MRIIAFAVLGSCAMVVSAVPSSHRIDNHHHHHHHHNLQKDQKNEIQQGLTLIVNNEQKLRREIHSILEKLFIQPDPSIKNSFSHDTCRLLPCSCYLLPINAPAQEIIVDVRKYAFYYAHNLKILSDGPKMGELSCWARKNFQQRVQNFGWDRLPQPQQYHAMARVLLQLLELAERAFGDSEGVLEKQQRMARWPNIRPTNVKHILESLVKILCQLYNIADISPPESAVDSSPVDRSEGVTDTCPICLGDYRINHPPATLRCGHIFGEGCIQQWLTHKRSCPVCRAASNSQEVVHLFIRAIIVKKETGDQEGAVQL